MIKAEKFYLEELSEDDLVSLDRAIKKELNARDSSQFPYKVGDCFCDCQKDSGGKAWTIVRIDEIDMGVKFTGIYMNITLDCSKFNSSASFGFFKEQYKTPIDPKIFELFSENQKAIGELKSQFANQVFKLRYDKRRTPSSDSSE